METSASLKLLRTLFVAFITTVIGASAASVAHAQIATVSGTVRVADTRQPVVGLQVFIPASALATITDENGHYVLRNVPPGPVRLQTRAIGYSSLSQTIQVGVAGEHIADFFLGRSAIALDQVVVTGTPGAVEKRSIGNAVATVALSEIARTSPATSVSALLNGRAAGVTTLSQSGSVGAGSAIRIRGAGSISLSTAPLIYVDGVRVDNTSGSTLFASSQGSASRLDDINPNDIASIEIIKGPAAATLYGTEASNGVIQIITKRGSADAGTVSIQLRTGLNHLPDDTHYFPLNWFVDSTGTPVSQNVVQTEADAGRSVFRAGALRQLDMSAAGGNQSTRYYLSGGYLANEGIYSSNSLRRLTARANVTATLSPVLALQGNLAYAQSTNPQMPEVASANFGVVPMIIFGSPASQNTRLRGFLRAPPEASRTIEQLENINRTTLGASATLTPAAWLTSRLNSGIDWVSQRNSMLFPYDPNGFFGALSTGNKTVNQYTRRNITVDWAATAKYKASAETQFATSVGVQYYDRTAATLTGTSQNFPAPGLETLSSGAVTTAGESFVENKTLGGFVQEEISSKNRRFLTFAVRGDANSAFGDKYKPAYYPKVSGAWVVSEEGIKFPAMISQLRLRGAYGYSGLQPDALASVRTYTPVSGTGGQSAILPQNPGNGAIRPERSRELELGFDADLFKGRGGVVFTYFNKRTNDAIIAVPSAPSSGFAGNEFRNLGSVSNRGFEIDANVTPVLTKHTSWNVGATVTRVTNVVNSLGGSPPINSGLGFGTIQIREGYPVGSFFAKKVLSADRTVTNGASNILCDDGKGVGMACASAPQLFIAAPGPGWELSLNSSLTLAERLTLSALVNGQFDTHMFSSMLFARDAAFRNSYLATHPTEMPLSEIASIAIGSNAPFVVNNSFAKVREVSLNYDIPVAYTKRFLGGRTGAVGLSARNLGFLYRHKDTRTVDPEGAVNSVPWVRFEQALTPQLRSYVFSLRVTY